MSRSARGAAADGRDRHMADSETAAQGLLRRKPQTQIHQNALLPFAVISISYLLFTVTDGAIRMIVLLHACVLGRLLGHAGRDNVHAVRARWRGDESRRRFCRRQARHQMHARHRLGAAARLVRHALRVGRRLPPRATATRAARRRA